MAKSQVDKILESDFLKLPKAEDLYAEFITQTNIEKVKEEDFVTRELLKGKTQQSIIKELSLMHPEGKFSVDDLNKFLERNRQLVSILEKEKTALARRHLDAKAKLEEELAQLAMYTKNLIKEYKEEGDNASTLTAVKLFSDLLMRFGKMAGFLETGISSQTNVNITQIISDKRADMANRTVEADFKMVNLKEEKDITEVQTPTKENETNNNRQENKIEEGDTS